MTASESFRRAAIDPLRSSSFLQSCRSANSDFCEVAVRDITILANDVRISCERLRW